MHKLTLSLILLLFINELNGQTDFEAAKKIAERTKEHDAVIQQMETTISFSYSKTDQLVRAKESSELQIFSLHPNNDVVYGLTYDDNITVDKAKSPGSLVDKICGNYRPEWVFHSDDMLCMYSIHFNNEGEQKPFIYERNYADVRYFTTYYFASRFPVLKSTVKFVIPEELEVEFKEFNTEDYAFKMTKNYDPNEKVTTVEFQCQNVPGYKSDEKRKPRSSFFYPHLLIIPKSYHAKDGVHEIFGSIDNLYQWSESLAQKTANTASENIKMFLNNLLVNKSSDMEKIKTMYYWVEDNIRYIAFEKGLQGYVPEDANKVFNQKYGDCKGKANLLKTMLTLSGYDARLTWIGTDDVRYDFSTPTLVTCNHMVCTLILNGKHYILDATSSYNPFTKDPEYLQGRQALIEDGSHYILDTVPIAPATDYSVLIKNNFSLVNNNLLGSTAICFNGERKRQILYKLNEIRSDERQKYTESIINRDDSKISVSNVTTTDIHNREDSLIIKGNIQVKGNIVPFENDLYVTIDPFEDLSDLSVNSDRQSPLDLMLKVNRKTICSFEIPEGYKLGKLPEAKSYSNDMIHFTTNYLVNGNIITYTKEIQTLTKLVYKKQFQAWNEALKLLKRTETQPIVITKTIP